MARTKKADSAINSFFTDTSKEMVERQETSAERSGASGSSIRTRGTASAQMSAATTAAPAAPAIVMR